jgi:hypothetical protein
MNHPHTMLRKRQKLPQQPRRPIQTKLDPEHLRPKQPINRLSILHPPPLHHPPPPPPPQNTPIAVDY